MTKKIFNIFTILLLTSALGAHTSSFSMKRRRQDTEDKEIKNNESSSKRRK